jgi:Long-chain fatty aldehyde decarbonylase
MSRKLEGSLVTDLGDQTTVTPASDRPASEPDAPAAPDTAVPQRPPRRLARGTMPVPILQARAETSASERLSMDRIMGLAVLGEKIAARTYALMAKLRPEHAPLLQQLAHTEGVHATWFGDICVRNGLAPDRELADKELGHLIALVDAHYAAGDFDALAVLQGFLVEGLAIATYGPFVQAARKYVGLAEVFARALEEARVHVEWVTAYLRERFAGRDAELIALVERVNSQGVERLGGTLTNLTSYLSCVGMSGADCAGSMTDEYVALLERVGIDPRRATKNAVSLFASGKQTR